MNIRNNVTLIGNLGNDPEIKQFENGNTLCRFSVATTEKYKNREGELTTDTQWHTVVAWGKTAELADRFLKKGASVTLQGKLTYRSYERDGEKRYSTEIVMSSFVPHAFEGKKTAPAPPPPPKQEEQADDDLPF